MKAEQRVNDSPHGDRLTSSKIKDTIKMYLSLVERQQADQGYEDNERSVQFLLFKIVDKLSPKMKSELCIKIIQKWPQLIPRALRE